MTKGLHRRAAKRDANESEIVDALRNVGATVQPISIKGVPDLLVGFRGENYLLEIKTKKGKRTQSQIEWTLLWNGDWDIVRTSDEVLRIIGAIE